MRVNNRYLIETADGYKDFLGVRESRNTGLIITHEKGIIHCTTEHQIMVERNIFKSAYELQIGDTIENSIITDIVTEENSKLYYDPVEVQGDNTYISDGITHHNCLVVDECIEFNTHITIRNKITGKIEKMKIGDFYNMVNSE